MNFCWLIQKVGYELFLWVEDFENSPKVTASNVLGSVFDDSLFLEDKRALKKNLKNQGVFY